MNTVLYAAEEGFDFDFHRQHHHGPSYFAVNVKNSCYIKLPQKYERRLERLEAWEAGTKEKLEQWSLEDTQEWWWEWATERAIELDLGKVYSAGRCGGWLVLNEYTFEATDNLCSEYTNECKHCGRAYDEHAKGQCLFQTTKFESASPESLETLRTLDKFKDEIAESAKNAHKDYDYNLRQRIDDAWYEYRQEKKRIRDESRSAGVAAAGAV